MRLLRIVLAIAAFSAATAAMYFFVYVPYRCDCIERDVKLRSMALVRSSDDFLQARVARDNLARLAPCLGRSANVNVLMLDAANRMILKDVAGTIESYRRAVLLEPRAETYFELGMSQLSAGQTDSGYESLLTAGAFYIGYVLDVPYPELRERLLNDLQHGGGVERVLRTSSTGCAR